MKTYTKSMRIEVGLLDDLRLVKRVLDKSSLSDTIRELMEARGYDKKWIDHMTSVFEKEAGKE